MKVKGHSMDGEQYQIRDQDLLLARRQDNPPEQGEVAVFQEQNSGTLVKIFRQRGTQILLESANRRFKDRLYDGQSPPPHMLGTVRCILIPDQED